MWHVDRSRYETGLAKCPRERYLRYHSGPNGYGITRSSLSMPLIVGTPVHDALADILRFVKDHDQLPTEEVIRAAIAPRVQTYRTKVEQHGVAQVEQPDPAAIEHLITEQTALLTGMVWTWTIEVLPEIHRRYRVLDVEQEETLVFDCSCELGAGGLIADHEARGCTGIDLMARGDFITDLREAPGSYGLHDFKTTSYSSERFESQWETKMQFALTAMAAERRYGVEFHEHYIHAIFKGARRRAKGPDGEYNGPKYQDSPFCYAWMRPGNPPLEPDDWKPTFEWVDDYGKKHRVSTYGKRPYLRTPVWTFPSPEGYDPVEYWTRMLPEYVRRKQLQLIGPLNRQRILIDALGRQLVAQEWHWQAVLEKLYEQARTIGPTYWTDPTFQALLDALVPQSWECRRYGKEHRCEFESICFQQPGWEDPLTTGYQLRRPHHAQELEQMQAQGLTPPDVWAEDDEA